MENTERVASKLILFDLDGTLYLDGVLFPGVRELIHRLREYPGLDYGFLTNNSTIGPEDYYRKLIRLGLELEPRHVVTSCEAACVMLERMGFGRDIYLLGTEKFRAYMESRGYRHTVEGAEALLIAFDTELTYRKLTEATRLVLRGVPVLATHPDPICPGDLPDAGMLLEYFKAAKPGTIIRGIAGKPHRWLVETIEARFGVDRREIIMVGDRVNTDMRFAQNFGMRSMMVLNGVEQPPLGDIRPTVIVPRIAQLNDGYWPPSLGWC